MITVRPRKKNAIEKKIENDEIMCALRQSIQKKRRKKKHANTYPIKYQDSIKFHGKNDVSKEQEKKIAHESTHAHRNSV